MQKIECMSKCPSNSYIKFLVLFPMLNLLFMHYFFYLNRCIEWTWLYSEVINLCSVIFDVFVILFLSLLLVRGHLKPALAITQALTIIWSFVNVIYGRFFFQYMSLSAIGEAHGLGDGLVINSIMSAFRWYDLYYVLSCIFFIVFYKKAPVFKLQKKTVSRLLLIPILSLLVTFLAYSTYHFIHPHYRNNWELLGFRTKEFLFDSVRGGTPNLAHFQTGCIRVAAFEIYDMLKVTELSPEQRNEISDFYKDPSGRTTNHKRNPEIQNVIFILLESFLSAPIDLVVDGKEVTPFLNSLKKDSSVYYNGNMKSDIGCGESGDGQFIYMNGILPLRYKMTVGQVKDNTLPALPIVLKKELGTKHSEIIFPTAPNLWQQADMNNVYGLTDAYSMEDIVGNNIHHIDDQEIFTFASNSLDVSKEPFFSLILSVSTHSPYDKYEGDNLFGNSQAFSQEYKNYLNTCHYTDRQIRTYFDTLKQKGIYDHSLIILAADHYAHLDMLKMDGQITDHTPLFIVHGQIDNKTAYTQECHQIDVYTTILDILGINNEWKGLGQTLLSPNYKKTVNEETLHISEMIIEGDFFKD